MSEGVCRKTVGLMCPTHGDEHWRRLQPVVRPRGVLTIDQHQRLMKLRIAAEDAQAFYREAVVETLAEGASFSEVAKATGLSTNTLQRWKREAVK